MDTTVSYWVRDAKAESAPLMEFVGTRKIAEFGGIWGDMHIITLRVEGLNLRSPLTPDFAERYDVIRRVSAPKPTPDAHSYVVTFVNREYVTPGGKHPEHQVELWSRELLDPDDVVLEDLAWGAAEVWPEASWADDNPAWWLAHVTLPNGTRLLPDGTQVRP